MSHADHNVLSLFVHIHPCVSSQNTRAEMEKTEPASAFASFFQVPQGYHPAGSNFIQTSFLWEFPGFVRNIILSLNLAWNTNLEFGVSEIFFLFQVLIFLLYQWVDLFKKEYSFSEHFYLRFSNTLRVLYLLKCLSWSIWSRGWHKRACEKQNCGLFCKLVIGGTAFL